jgi:hypothetical protein
MLKQLKKNKESKENQVLIHQDNRAYKYGSATSMLLEFGNRVSRQFDGFSLFKTYPMTRLIVILQY